MGTENATVVKAQSYIDEASIDAAIAWLRIDENGVHKEDKSNVETIQFMCLGVLTGKVSTTSIEKITSAWLSCLRHSAKDSKFLQSSLTMLRSWCVENSSGDLTESLRGLLSNEEIGTPAFINLGYMIAATTSEERAIVTVEFDFRKLPDKKSGGLGNP